MSNKNDKTSEYIEELKDMIQQANDGKPFSPWLLPQLRATAMNMVILDKLQSAIEAEESLTSSMTGSMGQQKIEVSPLLDKYYKAQSVLIDQFAALGLNNKGKRTGGKGEDIDPMAEFYELAKK